MKKWLWCIRIILSILFYNLVFGKDVGFHNEVCRRSSSTHQLWAGVADIVFPHAPCNIVKQLMHRRVRGEDCQPRPHLFHDAVLDLYIKLHLPWLVSYQDCQVALRLQVCRKLFQPCRTFHWGFYSCPFACPLDWPDKQTDKVCLSSFSQHSTSHLEYGSILAFCHYLCFSSWALTLRHSFGWLYLAFGINKS